MVVLERAASHDSAEVVASLGAAPPRPGLMRKSSQAILMPATLVESMGSAAPDEASVPRAATGAEAPRAEKVAAQAAAAAAIEGKSAARVVAAAADATVATAQAAAAAAPEDAAATRPPPTAGQVAASKAAATAARGAATAAAAVAATAQAAAAAAPEDAAAVQAAADAVAAAETATAKYEAAAAAAAAAEAMVVAQEAVEAVETPAAPTAPAAPATPGAPAAPAVPAEPVSRANSPSQFADADTPLGRGDKQRRSSVLAPDEFQALDRHLGELVERLGPSVLPTDWELDKASARQVAALLEAIKKNEAEEAAEAVRRAMAGDGAGDGEEDSAGARTPHCPAHAPYLTAPCAAPHPAHTHTSHAPHSRLYRSHHCSEPASRYCCQHVSSRAWLACSEPASRHHSIPSKQASRRCLQPAHRGKAARAQQHATPPTPGATPHGGARCVPISRTSEAHQ